MDVTRFETRRGARVYQMPVETFPGHVNNIYLIVDGDHVTLFDVGSGLPDSNAGLEARMAEVRERFGETATLGAVQHVVISHAHIDHFGWVGFEEHPVSALRLGGVALLAAGVALVRLS